MSGCWYEIQHSDGELVQRITVLTALEISNLRKNGFVVVAMEADKSLCEWIRPFAWGS